MDLYTEDTLDWLDRRFKETDADGIYLAHQPIYGFRNGHSEPGTILRYLISFNILRTLAGLRFDSLLDVGGAEGYKAALIREVFGCQVRSADLSAEACRRAKEIYGIDGEPVDIHRLPYDDGSFDVVLCSETLEHVPGYESATAELLRVARKAVVITVPHDSPRTIERVKRNKEPHGHLYCLDPHSFDFALPQLASLSCHKLLSLATRVAAFAAEGQTRVTLGPLPRMAIEAFNRTVPFSRALFGERSVDVLLRLDGHLAARGPYAGMIFVLLKDPAARTDRSARTVTPRQVIDFAVPFHYPSQGAPPR